MHSVIMTTPTGRSRTPAAVEVRDLTVAREDRTVVGNVSLDVEEGEVLALLGAIGSGATELAECIAGLRAPGAGTVHVFDHDPYLEEPAVRELLRLQQRGVPIATTPVSRPRVVVLDAPTAGLDRTSRRAAWSEVEDLRACGATVLLATHSAEEAEGLADRVALIDLGRLVALDTPQGLLRRAGIEQRLRTTVRAPIDEDWIRRLPEVSGVMRYRDELVVVGDERMVFSVVSLLAAHDVVPDRLAVDRPTLADVLLTLAGRRLADHGLGQAAR